MDEKNWTFSFQKSHFMDIPFMKSVEGRNFYCTQLEGESISS